MSRHIPTTLLRRARRWMTAGLVVSIVGTRVVEGGSDGAVASDVLPVVWLAIFATAGQGIGFLAPVVAKVLGKYNPSTVLVSSDVAEAILSALALTALISLPGSETEVIAVYLLLSAVFPAVTDVVEELYGQQIAQLDVSEALTFNATIYSVLAFVGLVLAMPAGAFLAGQSFVVLVAVNAVFSAIGATFRVVSSRTVVTPPVLAQDMEDFGVLGPRLPVRTFFSDLIAAGPASPLLAAGMQVGATIGGIFLYLWVAAQMPTVSSTGLAVVIAVFGVGATIGPWIAPALRARLSEKTSLTITYSYGAVLLGSAIIMLIVLPASQVWPFMLSYVFLIALFSRTRSVLTTTLRQKHFRGRRFASIMGWAFALTALGDIIGSWTGSTLRLDQAPVWALAIYLVVVLVGLFVVVRFKTPSFAPETVEVD